MERDSQSSMETGPAKQSLPLPCNRCPGKSSRRLSRPDLLRKHIENRCKPATQEPIFPMKWWTFPYIIKYLRDSSSCQRCDGSDPLSARVYVYVQG